MNTEQVKQANPSRFNPLLIIISIVLVLICIFSAIGVFVLVQNTGPISQVSVTGEASKKIKPDTARITLSYEQNGDDLTKLNSDADKVSQDVKQYLLDKGLKEENIVINKSAPYDYYLPYTTPEPGGKETPTKRIEVNFDVTFEKIQDDLQKPNQIIKDSISLGITRFGSFIYDVGDKTKLCEELEEEAIKNAYNKGTDRIKTLGGKTIVTRTVESQYNYCNDNLVYPYPARSDAMSSEIAPGYTGQIPPAITTGEQEVKSTVTVKFDYR